MIRRFKDWLNFVDFITVRFRSRDRILRWQTRAVKKLLRHASTTNGMWRGRLLDIDMDSITDLHQGEFQRIALIKKEDYLGRFPSEYTDVHRQHWEHWFHTSGTTQKPFSILTDNPFSGSNFQIPYREHRFLSWGGKISARSPSTRIALIKSNSFLMPTRIGVKWSEVRNDPQRAYLKLADFSPDVLISRPASLIELATLISNDATIPRLDLKCIFSTGEALLPGARRFVSEQFHAPVFDRYALEEMGVVAVECEEQNGMHVQVESAFVEIMNNDGHHLAGGQIGRVVITDLMNYQMPFIRYDTEDLGRMSYEACSCGLYTPRIWIYGRDNIHLSVGDARFSQQDLELPQSITDHALQYQIAKIGEKEMVLRIIPAPSWERGIPGMAYRYLREVLGSDIAVAVKVVSLLPRTAAGKVLPIADETKREISDMGGV